jgi:hypothetical protein
MAVDTVVGSNGKGRVVPFIVELVGKSQNFFGAELNAIPTSLAPVFNDIDNPFCYLDFLSVERLSPECHADSPVMVVNVATFCMWKNEKRPLFPWLPRYCFHCK